MNTEIRNKLKYILDNGYTQKRIANILGVSQPKISHMLNNICKSVTYPVGTKISEIYDLLRDLKMDNPNYYAILTADVRYSKDLKPMEKILYAEITALAQSTGECFARNSYFADLYDVTVETVSRWIANLKKYGFIDFYFLYKNGTKNIESRRISVLPKTADPIDQNINTQLIKRSRPYCEKDQGGIDQKIKDNNTSNNATRSNTTRKNNKIIIKESQNQKSEVEFEYFYNNYPVKKSKQRAKQYWQKLKNSDKLLAVDGIKGYLDSVTDKKYTVHPSTYIKDKRWQDEAEKPYVMGSFMDNEKGFVYEQ